MDLIPGRCYTIKNLRMIKKANAKHIHGRLGGDEQLITQIDDMMDDDVKTLLKRKDQWKREMERDRCSSTPVVPHTEVPSNDVLDSAAVVASEPAQQSNTILIKDVLASDTCPNTFRIVGRVTDYFPFDLYDFVFLWCTNCETEVPSNCRQCLKCDDLATSNVKCLYRFFLNIKDDSGANVQVAVCNEECPLLKGLPPVDLRDNKDALKMFTERLRPVIGNLDDAHKSWLDKTNIIDVVTPKLEFTIDSFEIEDGNARSYSLIDHRTS
ncbi:hypothetical protein SERLADRAFT_475862 [Serpula lacrymans var. lacrymans S7.9]|nr:uncharacterized protein SERLADRAFT_475862 [Serpula lacrymans var. lacrymans S7.9]EGO21118.1 hypothetical protein SERLADRAFT_475862 [Serpula lacrymans var. lacrymans S7.9]